MSKKRGKIPLGQFMKQFSSEKICRDYLEALRWGDGFVCPWCGHTHATTLSNGRRQCSACHHQTSVTAGTILHKIHLRLTTWFLTFYLVPQDKRGISATELAGLIGEAYKTAWGMLHWLHIIISNAKAFILGTYHGLSSIHLQSYLEEFAFRFSRCGFGCGLAHRLLSAVAKSLRVSA